MRWAAAAFAAGTLGAIFLKPGTFLLGVGIVVAGLGYLLSGVPVTFAAAGWVAAGLTTRPGPSAPAGPATLRGRVVSLPRREEDRVRFLLDEDAGRRFEVSSPDLPQPLAPGDRVSVVVEVREAAGPRNPGARDGASSLAAHGIAARATARLPPVRLGPPPLLSRLAAARFAFGQLASASLPAPEAALVRAIGAGDESGVDAATRERFARSGLAHVLSVSGLHLAVVASGAFWILRAFLLRVPPLASRHDVRRGAALLGIPVAAGYALATGATVPVLRSAVGAGLAFGAQALGRRAGASQALAVAALLLVALDPGSVVEVSFQLSFVSVLGLVALSGPLRAALPSCPDPERRAGRAIEAVLRAVCASAAATIATAPLLALHFRSLSTVAVLANLVAIPVASALTVLAALAYLASAVAPPVAALLLALCGPLATLFLRLNGAFAAPRLAAVGVASPGWGGVALAFGAGALALRARGHLRWVLAGLAVGAVLVPGPARRLAARIRPGIEVTFLSVGQGDCTIVRLPDGSALLVDAGGDPGGRYDPGARDVLPFLRDMGVDRLAAVFVSHPHPDHLQGLPAVVAGLAAERLFASHDRGDEVARAAFARMPPPTELAAGDRLELSGVTVEVLGPPPGERRLRENDASLVLLVRYGDTSFLLPGDVESAGEAALAARGVPRVDVVKAPHHGSRTSSGRALTAATRPRWVVFPVGAGNRYGFPHAETVLRWGEVGAEVLRTDEGPVRFRSDGRRVWRTDPAAALDAWALLGGG